MLTVRANDEEVRASLERLRGVMSDMRPALEPVAKELTRRVKLRFSFKRDPDGQRWPEWAPSTKKRAEKNPKRKLMLWTRTLRDKTHFRADADGLVAVMGASYGGYHEQFNTEDVAGKIPRRAFLFSEKGGNRGLSAGDETMMLAALDYRIRRALKGGGLRQRLNQIVARGV